MNAKTIIRVLALRIFFILFLAGCTFVSDRSTTNASLAPGELSPAPHVEEPTPTPEPPNDLEIWGQLHEEELQVYREMTDDEWLEQEYAHDAGWSQLEQLVRFHAYRLYAENNDYWIFFWKSVETTFKWKDLDTDVELQPISGPWKRLYPMPGFEDYHWLELQTKENGNGFWKTIMTYKIPASGHVVCLNQVGNICGTGSLSSMDFLQPGTLIRDWAAMQTADVPIDVLLEVLNSDVIEEEG